MSDKTAILRPHAEDLYAAELAALAKADTYPKPHNWALSPWAVLTYIMGGELEDGTIIEQKYFCSNSFHHH